MPIHGQCLCGQVAFTTTHHIENIYHCHCSLCRKQSGTAANAATLVPQITFQWQSGQQSIQSFKKATGFTVYFCRCCGSPVPNPVGNTDWIWIPLGLLDDEINPKQRLHFCLNSKSTWEDLNLNQINFSALPSQDELQQLFG